MSKQKLQDSIKNRTGGRVSERVKSFSTNKETIEATILAEENPTLENKQKAVEIIKKDTNIPEKEKADVIRMLAHRLEDDWKNVPDSVEERLKGAKFYYTIGEKAYCIMGKYLKSVRDEMKWEKQNELFKPEKYMGAETIEQLYEKMDINKRAAYYYIDLVEYYSYQLDNEIYAGEVNARALSERSDISVAKLRPTFTILKKIDDDIERAKAAEYYFELSQELTSRKMEEKVKEDLESKYKSKKKKNAKKSFTKYMADLQNMAVKAYDDLKKAELDEQDKDLLIRTRETIVDLLDKILDPKQAKKPRYVRRINALIDSLKEAKSDKSQNFNMNVMVDLREASKIMADWAPGMLRHANDRIDVIREEKKE